MLQASSSSPSSLTPAEAAVFDLLCQGLSNRDIATTRRKSEATIKHQVSEILRKHRVRTCARWIAAVLGWRVDFSPSGCVVGRRRNVGFSSHIGTIPAAAPMPARLAEPTSVHVT